MSNSDIDEMTQEFEIGNNIIRFKTGKLAKQSNGAILAESGGNGILITSTMSDRFQDNIDFFPLIVDVEERMYAAGKIPGGFFRREGKATDKAILNARLTDRPIRPIFDKNLRNEVQIVATILSVDQVYPYDVLIINGASCSLCISDIPFNEPIGAVRVGYSENGWIIDPSYEDLKNSMIDV